MAALPYPEATEPFGRFRFRGLDPKSVERWSMHYENENATLRLQVSALEARAAKADRFAEDAVKEMVTLQEIVKQAETDQAIFTARQRMFREEAAQIVHDAWAEANVVRAQTQQLIERTQAQLDAAKGTHAQYLEAMRAKMMEELEATIDEGRRTMATACEERQSQIAALEDERARIVAELERCTAAVLGAIAPLKETPSAANVPIGEDALTMLATTMRQSLRAPADAGWSGTNQECAAFLDETDIAS
ncbi:MAG: FliH/SctL family protein [Thermomicrobiales bacterium]